MEYLVTFLEGVITFISPCLLPMLPVYVAYFAGGTASASESKHATATSALGFILGFTALFVTMGALAGSIGSLFADHQTALNLICGIVVIALGLNYLGIFRIPFLQRTLKFEGSIVPRGFASSAVFGAVFAIGWTPCVGAFLGSALSMAAASGRTATGIALLLCYSLGLGLPFFIASLIIDQLQGAFSWVKRHYELIEKACGAVLVVVGALMACGVFGWWLRLLSA